MTTVVDLTRELSDGRHSAALAPAGDSAHTSLSWRRLESEDFPASLSAACPWVGAEMSDPRRSSGSTAQ